MPLAAWACLVLPPPRCTRLAVWCRAVESPCTVTVPGKRSTVVELYCSSTVAICSHSLHALTVLPAHMSYRPMMALMLSALETCTCVLGTCRPRYTDSHARLFIMLEARDP
jgi:hypothetical protein